jgi:hypothetical protein
MDCIYCEATGIDPKSEPCVGCNGTGEVECQNCNGIGDCPECHDTVDSDTDFEITKKVKLITIIDTNIKMYKNVNDFPVRVTFYWYDKKFDSKKKKWRVNAGEIEEDFGIGGIKIITFPINQKTKIKQVKRL